MTKFQNTRQFANYQKIILGNYEMALTILQSSLKQLEVTQERIKYDYYFETAEILRYKLYVGDYDKVLLLQTISFYQKALDFAERMGDITLTCCARLGIVLVDILLMKNDDNTFNSVCDVCALCEQFSLHYVLNYALAIKDYLESEDSNQKYKAIMNMSLIVM